MTRSIGIAGMGLFSLCNPMMVLVIALAQLGLPTTIAAKVAKNPKKSKSYFINGLFISIIISLSLMFLVLFLAPTLAINVFKNEELTLTIYALALLAPLVSLSALIKGYFIGLNEIKLTSFSTVMEEVGRIIFIVFFLDFFTKKGAQYAAFGAMIGVCVGEIFQSLYLILFSERHLYKRIDELMSLRKLQSIEKTKEILHSSIPLTLSRLIGSITYFFEPIIVTNLLLKLSYSPSQIAIDYGILSGYVMPLLLLPGFFAIAFSNFLLPNLVRLYSKNKILEAKMTTLKIIFSSLFIGLIFSIIFFFFGRELMLILYGNDKGYTYIRILAFPFLLYYLEAPLSSAMHALEMTKQIFKISLISCIIRILALIVFVPHFKMFAVALSTLLSIFYIVINEGVLIFRKIFLKKNESILFNQS